MRKHGWITLIVCVIAIVAGVTICVQNADATALTAARNTPQITGRQIQLGVKAGCKIFAGAMVAIDSSGYATNAADVASHNVIGRAHKTVDNSAGTNEQLKIDVDIGTFGWVNFGGVTAGNIGDICYVVDNTTVSVTNTGDNSCIAGVIRSLDTVSGLVYVDTAAIDRTAGAFTTLAVSGAAGFGSTLVVTGGVTAAAALSVGTDLTVADDATITDDLIVSGLLTVDETGAFGGSITTSNDLTTVDDVIVGDDCTVSGLLTVDETLLVGGTLTASGTVSAVTSYGSTAFGISATSRFQIQDSTQLVYVLSGVTNVIDADLGN